MMLQEETREQFLRGLISVDELLSELDSCLHEDLRFIEKHLPIGPDAMMIDREDLLSFLQNHPALCFRLAEILSRLYQNALQKIKSH